LAYGVTKFILIMVILIKPANLSSQIPISELVVQLVLISLSKTARSSLEK
jgi:hypothetical protein